METDQLDFKEDSAVVKESHRVVLDAALCLANTAGGTVVVGLDDDARGPDAFVGTTLDVTRVRKYVHDNSRPRLPSSTPRPWGAPGNA